MKLILPIIILTLNAPVSWATSPDFTKTPGTLCSEEDPNFYGYDYPEQIARCQRNVSSAEKEKIAEEYGAIPRSDWSQYEFDHLIPLCAGGSDDITNIWPQPISEAHKKDAIEDEVCSAMREGTLTQAEAVQKIHDWFTQNP